MQTDLDPVRQAALLGQYLDSAERAAHLPRDLGNLDRCAECGQRGTVVPWLAEMTPYGRQASHVWLHLDGPCREIFWLRVDIRRAGGVA